MLKVILDYPISVFLFVVVLIFVSIFFICILPDKWTDSDIFMCAVASVWAVILIAGIVATVIIFFSTKEPIDNFEKDKVDLNNASVAKVEYRPIEGFARKMFGETGTPEGNDETGEIKITLGSSENQNLKKIFEE